MPKIGEHASDDNGHDAKYIEIAKGPVKLGHVPWTGCIEIHSVKSGDEHERKKNGCDNGECFHDIVHALTYSGQIGIQQAVSHFTESFYKIDNDHAMIVAIAHIDPGGVRKKPAIVTHEFRYDFALRPSGAAHQYQFAPGVMNSVARFAAGVVQNFIFQRFQLITQFFEQGESIVHNGIN